MKYLKRLQLFEKKWNKYTIVRNLLSDKQIHVYYENNYRYDPDWKELLQGLDDLWKYVDDDAFVRRWMDDKVDSMSDDWEYEEPDEDKMIVFIKKNVNEETIKEMWKKIDETEETDGEIPSEKSIEEILDSMDSNQLKKVIIEDSDVYDFCYWYIHLLYEGSSAKEILSNYYDVRNNYVFNEDIYNITDYMDRNRMEEDYQEWYDTDSMADVIADNIHEDEDLQWMIYNNDSGPNSVILIENKCANKIINDEDFQKTYLQEIIETAPIGRETTILWQKVKKYIIDYGYNLSPYVIEEYDLGPLFDHTSKEFFGK